jgi:hypothetical protein
MPGQVGKTSSPAGTAEKKRLFQASLRDWLRYRQTPAFKRRAIFPAETGSLRDTPFSVVQKLRCALSSRLKITIATACLFDILGSHFAGNGGGKTALISALV